MTTICFRDGVLAADSRAYSGHATPIGEKCKIYRHRNGAMMGISTTLPGLGERMGAWFLDDKNPDIEPIFSPDEGIDALEIDPHGNVFFYHNSVHPSGPLHGEFFAIGSGANYALGALHMGADAVDAVRVGIMCDPWSGGEVMIADSRKSKEQNP